MRREIYVRVTEAAKYILDTGATVRACAGKFGVSKTTIHKDMRQRLKEISPALFESVGDVLDKNRKERHIRGGMATRDKYAQIKQRKPEFAASITTGVRMRKHAREAKQ